MRYYPKALVVERQSHCDEMDEVGYADQIMPYFHFDGRDAEAAEIKPGDAVSYRLDPDGFVQSVSAHENCQIRFGKIKEFRVLERFSDMLVMYEDGRTQSFQVAHGVFISKKGRPLLAEEVQSGDWVKLIINQAVIPGWAMESVREIEVEGSGHEISSVVSGKLSGLDPLQHEIILENASVLSKNGWSEARQISKHELGSDVSCYDEGNEISLDYLARYLKRAEGDVYLALENAHGGEKVKKISYRRGRKEPLDPDTILSSNGNGTFYVAASTSPLNADGGTIVVRHGRLSDEAHILPADYASVSLGGNGKAAVVDIRKLPGVSAVQLARGRVLGIDEGKSFRVESMAILSGENWVYTPVRRLFTMDSSTLLIDSDGIKPNSSFLGYTDETALSKVYNIAVDGSKAARIIDAPYPRYGVRGVVYAVEPNRISLKSATCLDPYTGVWKLTSATNATAFADVPVNSLVVKNNEITSLDSVEIGDQVRVMANQLPAISAGMNIEGYIVLVEK
jgi:hypothetical protein